MKVLINLGTGTLEGGCSTVIVQLLDRNNNYSRQFVGSLPPAPELAELFKKWQAGYRYFYQGRAMRIGLLESEGFRYSEDEFKQICQAIPQKLNQWLDCQTFTSIERLLRTELLKNELTQFIFATENEQLRQLPWHLWNFIDDYPFAEVALSSPNWQETPRRPNNRQKIRILAILGNSSGINVQTDVEALKTLPQTELVVLQEPQLSELNEYLWQSEGWNILLFSGHSQSDLNEGRIYLNADESITIAELKYSLERAIANGLQIAIFNSCEGIGLALKLGDLAIPYSIVMREVVPDPIAHIFLKYFLLAFATNKSFTLAVREARQRLSGWEGEYVCASWLPLIWQNPTANELTWQDLQGNQPKPQFATKQLWQKILIPSLILSSLVIVARSLAWLEPIELMAYDLLMQQRPAETGDSRILVVEITEADTNQKRYPLEDKTLVEAIDILEDNQPLAIGLDIHRSYPRGEGYADLIQRFEDSPRLFPVCAYGSQNDSYDPPSGLSPAKLREQMGFSDLLIDVNREPTSDRVDLNNSQLPSAQIPKVRRQLLSYDPSLAENPSRCLTPYSLSFQLAFEYLYQMGIEPLQVNQQQQWQFGEVVFQEMPARFGGYQRLEGHSGHSSQIPINYRSRQPAQRITLSELLSGKVEPQLIKNRIVLIGYTASVAREYFDTPYGTMAGVWIHAHMTSQILSAVQQGRPLIWTLPPWVDGIWIFAWLIVAEAILVLLAKKPVIYSGLAVAIIILILHYVCLVFLIRGGWLPYVPVVLTLLLATIITITFSSSFELSIKATTA